MKLLLINPKVPESFWSFKWALERIVANEKTLNPPLGLATLAALCPADWDVEIVDENVESVPLRPDADVVGVCGMGVQFARQKELLGFYRRKGYYVVAGGSYASLVPEAYLPLADTVCAGEAEYIWPEFCRDYETGSPKKLYRETGVVSLADSPTPRFDLLDFSKYRTASLQFSRGCPFRCEFCDIIVMFGRKPRTKPLDLVRRELDELRRHKVRSVFFVDDNFIGNKPRAKELLRYLAAYQKDHRYTFEFGTEVTITLANDSELLDLFHDANFKWVFIGIESPDENSLKETKKLQNAGVNLTASLRTIYSRGIDVLAGFIVGFDNDTNAVFDKQYDFIMESGIQSAMIGLLTAAPKTPLYERLEKEGRLIPGAFTSDNSKLRTNVMPKGMTYDEMITGYRRLHYRLFSDRGIADRIKAKNRHFRHASIPLDCRRLEALRILGRFFTRGLVTGGWPRVFHFLRSIPFGRPAMIPSVITDWITGLSMRDYMDRHFVTEFNEDTRRVRQYVDKVKEVFAHRRHEGRLGISFEEVKNAAASVSISMKGRMERESFLSVAKHAEALLANTRASITIRIEEFQRPQLKYMKSLLNRLSRYADRIRISTDESSRRIIGVDSSLYNLALQRD